jgi:uncharacterized protein YxjI
MTANPADWYPDPYGRHQHRYWDGQQWTEHVSDHGRQTSDPPVGHSPVVAGDQAPHQVQRQVQQQAGLSPGATQGGGTLMSEPVLVINQKAKMIEVSAEYAIYDQHGTQLGAIRQVGQSTARKVLRVISNVDQYLTHSLQVVDAAGAVVLTITRPSKVFKSKVIVTDAGGNEIGVIQQQNMVGKIRFSFEAHGAQIGSLNAENWRAWNFHILDGAGEEVARITKTWEGMAKTMFTTADNYVLAINRPLEDPLRSLVLASAASVDLALKQDDRGFN